MKVLVDAHIGRLICDILEQHGVDILRATSFPPKTSDEFILREAVRQGRVVMTSDRDFGELIFRLGLPALGLIYLRIDVRTELERAEVVQLFWPEIEPAALGNVVVVTSKLVRKRPLPNALT